MSKAIDYLKQQRPAYTVSDPEIPGWRKDNPGSDTQPLTYRFYEQRVTP